MYMDHILPSFFEEMEKLGVSKRDSFFMQSRRGRRSIRAHKLLEKENAFNRPTKDDNEGSSSGYEHEYGTGMEEKLGEKKDSPKRKAIRAAVAARPWARSAVMGSVPAAVAANFLIPATSSKALKYKSRIVAGVGALGAAAGVSDTALQRWSKRHPRTSEARDLRKQGAVVMRKMASLAADLRMKGLGGVKRPPFATEDSKRFAFNQLKNAKAPGNFVARTQKRHLMKPGPTISQISAISGE